MQGTPPLFPVVKNHKFGFINLQGDVVIELKYEFAGNFVEGYAFVIFDEKSSGYIDSSGNCLGQTTFAFPSQHYNFFRFSNGWAPILQKKKSYSFISRNGSIMDQSFEKAYPFSENRALVCRGGKWGFIDSSGQVVVDTKYDIALKWMPEASSFSEGLAMMRLGEEPGALGYIDPSGKTIIEPVFEKAFPFAEGLALTQEDLITGYNYIDHDGSDTMEFKERVCDAGSFSEGLADICVTEDIPCYGYIDKYGDWVIPPQFQATLSFKEGLAPVKLKGKWGYINSTGELVIPPQFTTANQFNQSLAEVFEEDTMGYINRQGEYVWKVPKPLSE